MSPTLKYLLISLAILCWPNYAATQTPVPDTIVAESPAGDSNDSAEPQLDISPSETSLEELLQRETALEENLFGIETNGPWDYQLFESLLALAQVRRDLGKEEEAREVYNRLLQNLRINNGVYSIEQLPILLDLMTRYLQQADYQTADELGDWAAFLVARNYSDEDEVQQQLEGYNQLINIRLNAPRSHACFDLKLRIENYENRDYDCMAIRRYRAEHFIGAFQLQKSRIELIEQQGEALDLQLMQQQARLANISIMTAGIVNGIHGLNSTSNYYLSDGYLWGNSNVLRDNEPGGYYRGDGTVRRRYDPEYYYLTAFRLIRGLQGDLAEYSENR